MKSVDFRTWVLSTLGRDDFTVTDIRMFRWIETARRQIQQAHTFGFMETSWTAVSFSLNDTQIAGPGNVKEILDFRVIADPSLNNGQFKILMVPSFTNDRQKFIRLITTQDLSQAFDDPDVFALLDVPVALSGFPLVINYWAKDFWMFPPISGSAVGTFLWLDYYGYLPFDISDLNAYPDAYTDGLLDEGADALFYRVLIEARTFFRDQLLWSEMASLYKDTEGRLVKTDTARRANYGVPASMEPGA